MRSAHWKLYAILGLVAVAAYNAVPAGPWKDTVLYASIAVSGILAILVGLGLNRPGPAVAWALFAFGQTAFLAGDMTFSAFLHLESREAPRFADVLYLSGYPLLALGLWHVIRARNRRIDWASLLDAAIVSIGAGVLLWVFLIAPLSKDLPTLDRAIAIAFPVMDLILLALAARLLFAPGDRPTSYWLLCSSIGALLAADVLYDVVSLGLALPLQSLLDPLFLLAYVLWGMAALHPSSSEVAKPVAETGVQVGWRRIVLLGAASLTAPAVLAIETARDTIPAGVAIVAGSVALFLLVLARLAGLIRGHVRALAREAVLREAGVSLVACTDQAEIHEVAYEAAAALVSARAEAEIWLVLGSPDEPTIVDVGGRPGVLEPALVAALYRVGIEDASRRLRGFDGALTAAPLAIGDELRGSILVVTQRELPVETADALRALARQVALALESQQLNEELLRRRSEARFRALVQHSSDVITVVDPATTIRFLAPSIESVLGYRIDELLGSRLTKLAHAEDQRAVIDWCAAAAAEDGLSAPLEFRVLAHDGSWRTIEAVASNLNDDPEIEGLVLTLRDVTRRHELEEELRQAQKLEALGRLAGGVAHDFNNLLTAIEGYSEFALSRLADADSAAAGDIVEIRRAAERAGALTRQLLAFGKRQVLQPRVLDLNSVLNGLERMLATLLGEKIQLRLQLEAGLGRIKVDPVQLEQVILNLVVNARDAMPEGGRLTIATRTVEIDGEWGQRRDVAPGEYVRLAVSDTGHGIDPVIQARIFEPFFTTKGDGRGTGLGLATVHGIVRQSGGDIELTSEVGNGTTFEVHLPCVREAAEVEERADVNGAPRGTETVLLVEDEQIVRTLVTMMLERQGYRTLVAADGKAALEVLQQEEGRVDLVVTDLVMPEMGGRELAERLSTVAPQIPVLFVSGYTEDPVIRQGVQADGIAFLEKPFTADELARKVREVLDETRAVDAARMRAASA
ncbi:MAG: response regulator [Thermoleophilia bacterium]